MKRGKGASPRHGLVPAAVMALVLAAASTSAAELPVWNAAWQQQREIVVQETAGYDRESEPVEIELAFTQPVRKGGIDALEDDIRREMRVLHYSPGAGFRELPCQVFDIRHAAKTRTGAVTAVEAPKDVFVRVRVAFFADVTARSTERYAACFDNPSAPAPGYETDLSVAGEGVGFTIDNGRYRIVTEEASGQIDRIDLTFATKPSFRFKYGTLHWNPDFIVVPEDFPVTGYTWWYAHHFKSPDTETESGPVFFSVRRKQLIPGQDTAYMEVYYRFYAGLPWFLMESYIEAKKHTATFAIRNDELAFGRTDFTHAGWRNKTPDMSRDHMGEIGSIAIYHGERTGGHVLGSVLPPNMAWISLAHPGNGYGVGSIRLEWENVNALTGEPSPTYNSHTVISEHDEGLYWFRSLIYSPRSSAGVSTEDVRKNLVDVPKGSSYREKNAYLLYEYGTETKYAPVDELWLRLRSPLAVTLMP